MLDLHVVICSGDYITNVFPLGVYNSLEIAENKVMEFLSMHHDYDSFKEYHCDKDLTNPKIILKLLKNNITIIPIESGMTFPFHEYCRTEHDMDYHMSLYYKIVEAVHEGDEICLLEDIDCNLGYQMPLV